MPPEADPGFGFGGQVERQRRKNRGTAVTGVGLYGVKYGDGPLPIRGRVWRGPENFHFWGLETRILVHSPAYLSVCFWAVIRRSVKKDVPVRSGPKRTLSLRMSGNDEWPFVQWPFVRVAFCPVAFCPSGLLSGSQFPHG